MYNFLIVTSYVIFLQDQIFSASIIKEQGSDVCDTDDCHQAATYILKWLNKNIDPCDDFYEFACGNWRNIPEEEREKSTLGARGSIKMHYVPELLKDASATKASPIFEKVRNFLVTCMDEERINELGVLPIQKVIQEAGGWPVLDPDWSGSSWDLLEAEMRFGGVILEVGTDFDIYHSNRTSIVFILKIGQPKIARIEVPDIEDLKEGLKSESVKEYYNMIVEVAVKLGADKAVAEKAMLDVLEFEKELFEELHKKRYLEKTVTLKKLYNTVPWLNLEYLLSKYVPISYKMSPETRIVADIGYFRSLKTMIDKFPHETFVNYWMIKAVHPLLEYVTLSSNSNNTKEGGSREEYCIEGASQCSLGPAVSAYIAMRYNDDVKIATEMMHIVKEELVKEVDEIDWFDEKTRDDVRNKINELSVNVGFNPSILDLKNIEAIYKDHEMNTDSFFDSVMDDRWWIKEADLNIVSRSLTVDELRTGAFGWRFWILEGSRIDASYNKRINTIDVSGPFLFFLPLFGAGSPAYVNYGHIGSIVAHELIHALDLNAVPERRERKGEMFHSLVEKWSRNETESKYKEKKECFIDFYSSINDTMTNKSLRGNQTQREDMADNGGLKLALRAYRKLAVQLGSPERKLPQLQQYSAEQLFMISVANAYCEIPNAKNRNISIEFDLHSPQEYRVKGMMMNSPDFSKIFNCDKNDPMNIPDKCEVWLNV